MAGPAKSDSSGAMRIDTDLVRELAALLDESNLTEIKVEDGDRKIKVKRSIDAGSGGTLSPAQIAAFGMVHQPAASPTANTPSTAAPGAAPSAGEEAISGNIVKSPMVGTAFLSPEPGAKPFVAVGDSVKAGQTLLIVEAMKVMNPITAPSAGTVSQLMVSDAQPVEYDQPLVVIG